MMVSMKNICSCFRIGSYYLDENQLTNIQFVTSLKNLTHLGINNNYVTDLSPLNQVEGLKYLDVRQNPVGSVDIGADITVLK